MKKRILSLLLCCVLLVVLLPVTVSATEGTATVTLVNQSDWQDGSGYQMLMDSTATAYGTHIALSGPLARNGDSTEEVYSSFAYKIPTDAGWTRDTQAVVHYGSSQTIKIPAGIYDFCITNPTPGESIWIVGNSGEAYSRADDFEFKAGMHYTFTTSRFGDYDGVTLTMTDVVPPVISGLTDGKSYCGSVSFTASDNIAVQSVTVNGTELQPVDGVYMLNPADGTQTVVVSDADNQTTVSVTVNDGHTYEWQSESGQYWQKCKFCGDETAKKDIPTINLSGSDRVCRTQDYKFSFTLPEGVTDATYGYEFIGLSDGSLTPTVADNLYSGILKATIYPAEENGFRLIVSAKTADGFELSAEKTVTIQNAHSGGTATCKDKAKCEICGESYGELDSNNHAEMKHIEAKAATKTSEGNIEYWYCEGCGKYFADKDGLKEITKAQTVTAKLPSDNSRSAGDSTGNNNKPSSDATTSPQTGDNSNLVLWVFLLFVSGGAGLLTSVCGRKKKRSVK